MIADVLCSICLWFFSSKYSFSLTIFTERLKQKTKKKTLSAPIYCPSPILPQSAAGSAGVSIGQEFVHFRDNKERSSGDVLFYSLHCVQHGLHYSCSDHRTYSFFPVVSIVTGVFVSVCTLLGKWHRGSLRPSPLPRPDPLVGQLTKGH